MSIVHCKSSTRYEWRWPENSFWQQNSWYCDKIILISRRDLLVCCPSNSSTQSMNLVNDYLKFFKKLVLNLSDLFVVKLVNKIALFELDAIQSITKKHKKASCFHEFFFSEQNLMTIKWRQNFGKKGETFWWITVTFHFSFLRKKALFKAPAI